jgi:methionyl-tRNA synthetase
LITSALPYINGVKHLGNMVGSMLPADVYARYLRARGNEVLYICATDEHGTPAELAAAEAGLPVADFCAGAHLLQKGIYDGFEMSFDYFGRSSSPQNEKLTQHFARKLYENGFIEERAITQIYSPADGRFLPDRYVEGTCPKCGYDRARGDQCENCTSVLDPTELLNPRSAISGATDLEVRETKHLFLLQSKLQPAVETWLEKHSSDWPLLATSIARKWLTEGLRDRAITRDLDWGVPVPADVWPDLAGEGKVFYVWFDAPIEYLGATWEWADAGSAELSGPANLSAADSGAGGGADNGRNWRSWWRLDEGADNVRYTQFMAKDNVPFHTVMFPATQIGTNEPWKMVDYVKGFSWLTYYGGKFSTSLKRGIFTDAALELLPADYWRYYLIANAPESDDSSFTWEQFVATVNKDLADTLGNFVNRVLTLSIKNFGNEVPAGGEPGEAETKLAAEVQGLLKELQAAHDSLEFRKAAQALRALWAAGNAYLVEKEPWKQVKQDKDAAALTLRTALGLIWLYGIVSAPLIPLTAARLRSVFSGVGGDSEPDIAPGNGAEVGWVAADFSPADALAVGIPVRQLPVLFAKIPPEQMEAYREQFGGAQ